MSYWYLQNFLRIARKISVSLRAPLDYTLLENCSKLRSYNNDSRVEEMIQPQQQQQQQ
jgi:hypothetical protein